MASFWVKAENDWRTELAAPVTVSEIFSAIGSAGDVGSNIFQERKSSNLVENLKNQFYQNTCEKCEAGGHADGITCRQSDGMP
jgi:hypothetical protein